MNFNTTMKHNISSLIKIGILSSDGTLPGFNVSTDESKQIIQHILQILNHPVFICDPQVFFHDAKMYKPIKKKGEIHPYESALFIVKENLNKLC